MSNLASIPLEIPQQNIYYVDSSDLFLKGPMAIYLDDSVSLCGRKQEKEGKESNEKMSMDNIISENITIIKIVQVSSIDIIFLYFCKFSNT